MMPHGTFIYHYALADPYFGSLSQPIKCILNFYCFCPFVLGICL